MFLVAFKKNIPRNLIYPKSLVTENSMVVFGGLGFLGPPFFLTPKLPCDLEDPQLVGK